MLQAMNALIIRIFVIIFFAINLLAAQGLSCADFESKHNSSSEHISAQGDKEESFVFAEYCIYYNKNKKDGAWQLARTEQFMPMPSIKIGVECVRNYFISTDVGNFNEKIVIGSGYFKKWDSCVTGCSYEINDEYKIDEDFETIFTMAADSIQALSLTNKIFSFKWNMDFTCNEKKLYDLSGIFDVKISSFCNKEQLKKIEESKKNEKKKK
jgi:hypothetical protein